MTWWEADFAGNNWKPKRKASTLFGNRNPLRRQNQKRLIQRLLNATQRGDWVLDSFAGSGTTGAVAHKMGRRWIMVELGEHCHTHIIPTIEKSH